MAKIDYDHLIQFLPHQGPMRLIDSVIRLEGMSVETSTLLDSSRAGMFGNGSGVESCLGIELLAQSAAIPMMASAESGKHGGMIIQVQSFKSHRSLNDVETRLTTKCRVELMMDGTVALVTGEVWADDFPLCEGKILLAVGASE